jgi:hypothetical protein
MANDRAEGGSPVKLPNRAKMIEKVRQQHKEAQARAEAAHRREEQERKSAEEEAEADRNWIIQQVRVNARSLDYVAGSRILHDD